MPAFIAKKYECAGSVHPRVVRYAFDELFPIWQQIDWDESNRLLWEKGSVPAIGTDELLARRIQAAWPIKNPSLDLIDFSLEEGVISMQKVISVIRLAEEIVLEEKLPALMVYWSRHSAIKFLPQEERYRELVEGSLCVSVFSAEKVNPPEEWCFWLESNRLCLVIYGMHKGSSNSNPVSSNMIAASLNGEDPHSARVPRKPLPHKGDTYISLPQPKKNTHEID